MTASGLRAITHVSPHCAIKAAAFFCAVTILSQPPACSAAVLHGRVKDQQCSVLSRIRVRIHAISDQPVPPLPALETDDSGNYTVDLPAGKYRICFERPSKSSTCQQIDILGKGDTWVTTQLRETTPHLSSFGNRSY